MPEKFIPNKEKETEDYMRQEKIRCAWPGVDERMRKYHDTEWGTPCHNDKKLFEYLLLDSFQAGLSWAIILNKRDNFRRAFAGFNSVKIAGFSKAEVKRLLKNTGIVRNRLKIEAAIQNANAFLSVQKEIGSFDQYIWGFVDGWPLNNKIRTVKDIGATSKESDAMSKDLKRRGFRFVGSTICYAFMQGAGLVNDHEIRCFRHSEISNWSMEQT